MPPEGIEKDWPITAGEVGPKTLWRISSSVAQPVSLPEMLALPTYWTSPSGQPRTGANALQSPNPRFVWTSRAPTTVSKFANGFRS